MGNGFERDLEDLIAPMRVKPGSKVSLEDDFKTDWHWDFVNKQNAAELLVIERERLSAEQDKLYAADQWSVLLVIQAMDAAGKDSLIKHVMSGINPQGCQVYSFKAPNSEELDHDFLWRCQKALPERGRIGIFNRSHYEEVLVVRVHPAFLKGQRIPEELVGPDIWHDRMRSINDWERHISENGTKVIKVFLNVSKEEQRQRFLQRIDEAEKNWKFNAADVKERDHWDEYMAAYEDMLGKTSTEWAPWYVVPADRKWFTRLAVQTILLDALQGLDLHYPVVSDIEQAALQEARAYLETQAPEGAVTRAHPDDDDDDAEVTDEPVKKSGKGGKGDKKSDDRKGKGKKK